MKNSIYTNPETHKLLSITNNKSFIDTYINWLLCSINSDIRMLHTALCTCIFFTFGTVKASLKMNMEKIKWIHNQTRLEDIIYRIKKIKCVCEQHRQEDYKEW